MMTDRQIDFFRRLFAPFPPEAYYTRPAPCALV
jgi:hypothetical protein